MTSDSVQLMRKAIQLSLRSVAKGGGPFGAVVVKDGKIVATGSNGVTLHNDPTAHAEVVAIRKAAKKLGTFDLAGCEIYASCEPCPMCLSAIYWARIDKIHYANTKHDAQSIGFDDSFIYEQIALPESARFIPVAHLLRDDALKVFQAWQEKEDKVKY